ncbi:MAG TPA: hypothetical protein PLQ59_09230 [Fervidobacterium sp.]|nr:hypothetical protein [Fervidobacterium sp.]
MNKRLIKSNAKNENKEIEKSVVQHLKSGRNVFLTGAAVLGRPI